MVRLFEKSVPRASSSGEHLRIATLAKNEEVLVSRLFSHRTTVVREYRFGDGVDPSRVRAWSMSADWVGGVLVTKPERLLAERSLKKTEAEGLDDMIAYFRVVREEFSSADRHYRLTYFRDGKKIGEEFYIGFSLPSDLAYFESRGYRNNPDYSVDYTKLAQRHGVSRSRLDRMFAFEMLENEGTLNNAAAARP